MTQTTKHNNTRLARTPSKKEPNKLILDLTCFFNAVWIKVYSKFLMSIITGAEKETVWRGKWQPRTWHTACWPEHRRAPVQRWQHQRAALSWPAAHSERAQRRSNLVRVQSTTTKQRGHAPVWISVVCVCVYAYGAEPNRNVNKLRFYLEEQRPLTTLAANTDDLLWTERDEP